MTDLAQLAHSLEDSAHRVKEIREEIETVIAKRDYQHALVLQSDLRKPIGHWDDM
jgi:HPt (histidine-containing phosphotransfer) domain-containing protein